MAVGMSLCFARRHRPARRAIPTAKNAGRVGIFGGWYQAVIARPCEAIQRHADPEFVVLHGKLSLSCPAPS